MADALRLNGATEDQARAALLRCCGSRRWVEGMLERRPFASTAELSSSAELVWAGLAREDYLEAFAHHPPIGLDMGALRAKYGGTAQLAAREQASVARASEATLQALRAGNLAYSERFGFTFIVCATGKSAEEMRALLELRLKNETDLELSVAAAEQAKITALRLENLEP